MIFVNNGDFDHDEARSDYIVSKIFNAPLLKGIVD